MLKKTCDLRISYKYGSVNALKKLANNIYALEAGLKISNNTLKISNYFCNAMTISYVKFFFNLN
jgi:hypothetical protein